MSEDIQRESGGKKQEIVQAAHDLFVKQGYHGTSMRQIARSAEIALGGLYYHFNSKEQVFKEVFLRYHPYHDVMPVLISAEGETVEQVVGNAIKQMIQALGDRPDFMNLMFIEVVEFNSEHVGELASSLRPYQLEIVERIVQLDRDRLRPIPPLMLIRTFFGLFFSYLITEIVLAKQAPEEMRENALEYFIDIYLHGILRDNAGTRGIAQV
ncbi:MAG: TetR/AcrR family transcriptional regulator [Anaerolineales bacterium]